MSKIVGLDFGTTNSALGVLEPGGPRLATFATDEGPSRTFRSVLYFDPDEVEAINRRPRALHGPRAIERYMEEDDGSGRLIQALKTWLPSRLFEFTVIGLRHRFTLEDLIGGLVGALRAEAEAALGPLGHRAVVGRPVHMSRPADPERDALAIERLRRALARAGFEEVHFVYEPVAAAYHYEQRLEHDELVLIADFGGGTSDFSLIRVGPSHRHRPQRQDDVLGTAGVPIAGNAFDSRVVQRLVAPHLGLGSTYRTEMGRIVEIPPSVFKLDWHELATLRGPETLRTLHELRATATEPHLLDAFIALVEHDLAYHLYRAVESTKAALSHHPTATFRFHDDDIHIEETVRREDFEAWIAPELEAISSCVDDLFERLPVDFGDVDRVFLTGGSSFIPAVRDIFATRFGADRLRTGEELTSVVSGLALHGRALLAD